MIEKVTMKEAEGALKKVDDIEYVRCLDKNGDPVYINKDDFATVLGGLLSAQKLYPFMDRGLWMSGGSLDDITTPGMYGINADLYPVNNAPSTWGILEVVSCKHYNSEGVVQTFWGTDSKVRTRLNWGKGKGKWMELQIVV